jgi:hypothetical protein
VRSDSKHGALGQASGGEQMEKQSLAYVDME